MSCNIFDYGKRCGIDCHRAYPIGSGGLYEGNGVMQAFQSLLACINKYDINEKVAEEIESFCRENDVYLIGKYLMMIQL